MAAKMEFRARALGDLRAFLVDADLDYGCRPVAVKSGPDYVVQAVGDPAGVERLRAARSGLDVTVRVIEEVGTRTPAQAPAVGQGDRFERPGSVRGFARKE
jgi:hypothetical protein